MIWMIAKIAETVAALSAALIARHGHHVPVGGQNGVDIQREPLQTLNVKGAAFLGSYCDLLVFDNEVWIVLLAEMRGDHSKGSGHSATMGGM